MKKKILIVQPIHQSGIDVFDDRFEVKLASDPSVATVLKEIGDAEGALVRTAPITREIMKAAPQLKVIGRHGVGVDNIDMAAATELGILVVYTPEANAVSVAETTITVMGALAKRTVIMDRNTRTGNWKSRDEYKMIDLDGKVLGLVGIGRVGSQVARKAQGAFDMKVLAYDPFVKPEVAAAAGITLVSDLGQIFREADVVSLHTPLTPETRNLVNTARLATMKPSAFLINLSRGEVVDEAALYQALTSGTIAGAALDVYQQEPPAPDNPLFTLENVVLSPHCAALTRECVQRMATGSAQGIKDVLTGQTPRWIVNPAALAHRR